MIGLQVEDSLVEALRAGRAAVVRHVRWQQGDQLTEGAAFVLIQVVADSAVVNDQEGPGVVRVHGVGVVGKSRMQHFHHTVKAWSPRSDLVSGRPTPSCWHVKIVQDRVLPAAQGGAHAI